MAFDDRKYNGKATGGDVGGVALNLSVAIDRIADALAKIAATAEVDISAELEYIRDISTASFAEFEEVTGWVSDDGD